MAHTEDLVCSWCGDAVDADLDICAELDCTRCSRHTYHQCCIESCVRKQGIPTNRKTGFFCPRGKGKFEADTCKGIIESTHKIFKKKVLTRKKKKDLSIRLNFDTI